MLTYILELTGIPVSAWAAAFVVGLLTLFYIYLTWNFNYWQSQGIKCDRPWPLWGTISNPFTVPQDIQDTKCYGKYGKIYGIYEGRVPSLHIADPELLKQVLVKDFNKFQNRRDFEMPEDEKVFKYMVSTMKGEEWRQHRNIITPAFTTGKMKQMLSSIEDCAKQLLEYLRKNATDNETVEVTQCLATFTLDVIARCAFGTKIDFWSDNPDTEFVRHASTAFSSPPKLMFLLFIFPKLAKYLPPFMPQETQDYFADLVSKVIDVRQKETNTRKDFLHIMMDARAEFEKGNFSLADGHTFSSQYPITKEHIIANSIIFIIAGFETTSTTLSFAMYELALNKDVQENLIREIDDVLAEHDGKLNYEVIGEMQYLEMVIAETLRKYPPVPRLERSCIDDCEINGIKLKKNHVVGIPVYAMHHDEELYPEPAKFDPERFSSENKNKRNPYTYLPFGYGPRNCIGMRFAQMEMKIALAYILKEFRIKTNSQTDIPYIRKTMSSFLKAERMNLVFERRN